MPHNDETITAAAFRKMRKGLPEKHGGVGPISRAELETEPDTVRWIDVGVKLSDGSYTNHRYESKEEALAFIRRLEI